ncbi:MAG: PHP domain-containing protein [Gaiellaceae bacterium]
MHLRAPDESIEHSVEAVERYVEVAAERGIDEIGFTEHVYYFRQTKALWVVDLEPELDRVAKPLGVDDCVDVRLEVVLAALELVRDRPPAAPRRGEMDEILEPYPWDYLLGSLHFVDGQGIDGDPSLVEAVGPATAWTRYYEWLVDASAYFDVLAHPDLVKMYGPELEWDWGGLAASLGGACLEVSSAGLHKPHGKLYPNPSLLAAAKKNGIQITTASDAHVPQNVGRDLDRAIEHARSAGYDTVTVFAGRDARQEPLG